MLQYVFFAFFVLFFLLMIIRPDIFNQARDEKARATVSKIMRVCGIIGLGCIVGILAFQLAGLV